jgi:hypothetical protein
MITRAQLLFNFRLAQIRLDAAKAIEMRWRMLVTATFDNVRIGANVSDDGAVKMIARVGVKLDDNRDKVSAAMSKIASEFPDINFNDIVDWKYTISQTGFLALPDEVQTYLSDIVTITPGTPTVSIVE